MLFIPLCRSIFHLFSFFLCLKASLIFSYSTVLLVINSFSFCIYDKVFILPSSFGRHFWCLQNSTFISLFSSSILKILLHCLLAFIVSNEKFVLIYLFLYMLCLFFPLSAFKVFLFLLLLLSILLMMHHGVIFFIFFVLQVFCVSWISEL